LLGEFLKHHNEIFFRFGGLNNANVEQAARLIAAGFENDGKLYVCGIGLSACFAQYITALFNRHHAGGRPSLPALALSQISLTGDDELFTRQISSLITDKDILLGISAIPPYDSIQKAFHFASLHGAKNIALVGSAGGSLKNLCDAFMDNDLKSYLDIQELHLFILHSICEMVGALMFRQV
jgi:D-sedoheptulose 7-phosphate isomerase